MDFLNRFSVPLGFGRGGISCTMPREDLSKGNLALIWYNRGDLRRGLEIWGVLAPKLGDLGPTCEALLPGIT